MTDASEYEARFEQIIRRIHGKPEHVPPPLGKTPNYITEDAAVTLGTNSRFQRARSAIERGEKTSRGALTDYLDTFIGELHRLVIEPDEGQPEPDPFLDAWFKSIEDFKPYRDQFLDLVDALCKYQESLPTDQLHGFLERFLVHCYWPSGRAQWSRHFRENFQFMAHELLIHLVAVLLHHERFREIDALLSDFVLPEGSPDVQRADPIAPFTEFRRHYRTLEVWNQENETHWLSPIGHWFKARATHPLVSFGRLMEADFVLFLRADLLVVDERWWPMSLAYVGYHPAPFRLFLRARSARYFDKLKVALGCESIEQLAELGRQYLDPNNDDRSVPRWQGDVANPVALSDLKNLASKP